MNDIVIRSENLSKRYKLGAASFSYDTLSEKIAETFGALFRRDRRQSNCLVQQFPESVHGSSELQEDSMIWALKDVNFEIRKGDIVGIIGRNGAGKSTLLKILSRITEPTQGYVEIRGRVGSLLEVGTGFHGELTGRENIYLSGAILGMKRAEIDRKFDEIVGFAEVEKFIDTPVKRYSSGMYLRLAFAVAAHLEPEILIVDEVLAVGDTTFQKKCLGKMENVSSEGRTVLFVSHNLSAVENLCTRGFLLESGNLLLDEETDKVVAFYLKQNQGVVGSGALASRTDRHGDGSMRFTNISLLNRDGIEVGMPRSGEDLIIALDYETATPSLGPAVIRLSFTNIFGQRLFMCVSRYSHNGQLILPSNGQIRCKIPKLPLLPGHYTIGLWCKLRERVSDKIENAFSFEVASGDYFGTGKINPDDGGSLLVDHTWEIL